MTCPRSLSKWVAELRLKCKFLFFVFLNSCGYQTGVKEKSFDVRGEEKKIKNWKVSQEKCK